MTTDDKVVYDLLKKHGLLNFDLNGKCPKCSYNPILDWFNFCPMCKYKFKDRD